ncbi:hypothetical protein Pan216_08400 [Planctomycetes bacterium Pan216]|uniref:Uncharacterized protein n=1 Tax=Kolteria novifilia TaxID=2527975 RepID=A0A518AZ42_9BACT|nr:hypothetical protein Pan216_08400 [Planctomycetes bacterium Pan216]
MSTSILTTARQSVWAAIDEWPALAATFRRKWKFEDTGTLQGPEPAPSLGDLPGLAISPASQRHQWAASQTSQILYALDARLWTRHWDVRHGEELIEEITKALYQSGPEDSSAANLPFVEAATRYPPESIQNISAKRVHLARNDGPRATLWSWTIVLRIKWNPRTAS